MRKFGTLVPKGYILLIIVLCQPNMSVDCHFGQKDKSNSLPTKLVAQQYETTEPSKFAVSESNMAEISSTTSSFGTTTELRIIEKDQSSSSTLMTPNYKSYKGEEKDDGKMITIIILLSLTTLVVIIIVGAIILYYNDKLKRMQSNSQETVKMSVVKDSSEEYTYGNMAGELSEVDSVTYASLEFLPTTSAIKENTSRPVNVLDHRTDYAVIQTKKDELNS